MLASRKAGLKDFELVDVRETGEHDIVRIDGSVLIPQGRILAGEAWAELPQDKDIVFHCKAGTRSANVLAAARKAGYQRVSHLDGGILAWVRDVEPEKPVY
jgi:adenylyltransferase/sulfurtransferase